MNATTDGVVLAPSAFAITVGSPPSITATHEFVVPKSIPIILDIINYLRKYFTESVGNLNHTVADYTVTDFIALSEFLGYNIFAERFIVNMHHSLVN